jgi:hypothetical protein
MVSKECFPMPSPAELSAKRLPRAFAPATIPAALKLESMQFSKSRKESHCRKEAERLLDVILHKAGR